VGANEKTIQGRALKPRGWVGGQEKKYLVVLLIHGGPQGAWEDGWSTRWNPNGMRFIFSWRLDYSFFFLVQVSPVKAISSSLSILLEARLSDKVNLTLLPLNDH